MRQVALPSRRKLPDEAEDRRTGIAADNHLHWCCPTLSQFTRQIQGSSEVDEGNQGLFLSGSPIIKLRKWVTCDHWISTTIKSARYKLQSHLL